MEDGHGENMVGSGGCEIYMVVGGCGDSNLSNSGAEMLQKIGDKRARWSNRRCIILLSVYDS